MYSIRIAGTAGVVIVATCIAGLTGCSSTSDNGASGGSSAGGSPVEVGNTINYTSTGSTNELDCGSGKSLTIGGANNTLTVKGTCATVNIGGTDNKVKLDKISTELDVVGMNATVTYKDGSPKVSNTGSGNTVQKG
ncbi:hypothetical protein ABIA30_001746 [Mycobacterium sp. MAA66]|jgi:hypothetical protein|uniref:DUF3060 domain-containing protein n=1 Tax=Mycobacterium sp. MAA66 TaxID=3156297 RepID=UPI003515E8FC